MNYIAGLIIGVIVLFGGGLIAEKGSVSNTVRDFSVILKLTKETPTPTEMPLPTEIPTSYPTPTVYYVAPTANPDPIINCQNPNCGPIQIRRSLCSDVIGYVCCKIGNNWIWYASRDKCSQDQNSANSQNKPNYTYPTYTPLPTWIPLPTWAPLPTFAPLPTIDSTARRQNCIDEQQRIFDELVAKSCTGDQWGSCKEMLQQGMERAIADCNRL